MTIDKKTLPDAPELLKQIVIDLQKKQQQSQLQYDLLEEKYLILREKFFARRSEKTSLYEKAQMLLFNEAETECDADEEPEAEQTTVKTHTRKKRGRKKLPDDLRREAIIYDLSPEEKECPCCGNERLRIGSEELDIIPAKIQVNKHVRKNTVPVPVMIF